MSGLPWLLAVLLIVILGPIFGGTHYWNAIYLSTIFIAFVIAMSIWLVGTVRAIQEQRKRRADR